MRERIGGLRGRLAGGAAVAVLLGGGAALASFAAGTAPKTEPHAQASTAPPVPADIRETLPGGVEVVQKWSLASNGKLLRVYSARRDLSDYSEMRLVPPGKGERRGDAYCTQQIQLTGKPVETKPTLLLCWRTTARKSVYTVLVDTTRKPSATESVAQLDAAWKKLS